MKIFPHPVVILDVETTGFSETDDVIEIGAVCLDEYGRVRTEFGSLIQNQKPITAKEQRALDKNNITESQLNDAPTLPVVSEAFISWWNGIPKEKGCLALAFNLKFDRMQMNSIGINLPWGECLMLMTKQVMTHHNHILLNKNGQKKGQASLKDACEFLGLTYPENAHRALEDARVTALVAQRIVPMWHAMNNPPI